MQASYEDPPNKCDKCEATCGNYQYAPGKWRCPKCIWQDHEQLVGALCVARSIRHMRFGMLRQDNLKHCNAWNDWYDVQCEELVERHCGPIHSEPLTEQMARPEKGQAHECD